MVAPPHDTPPLFVFTSSIANKVANSNTLRKISDVASDTAKVSASIDPFNLALNVPLTGAGQGVRLLGAGEDVASNLYESALKPSMTIPQKQRKAIVKTALDKISSPGEIPGPSKNPGP